MSERPVSRSTERTLSALKLALLCGVLWLAWSLLG
jgi:hypothetical protein